MSDAHAKTEGHETSDISARDVSWFALGLVVCVVVIGFGVVGFYRLLERAHPSPDSPSRIVEHPQPLAPEPRLQNQPAADFEKFEAQENARLNSYGWIDQSAGIAHIPIARAMQLIVERGLPTRGPGTQNASGVTPEQLQQQKAGATKP